MTDRLPLHDDVAPNAAGYVLGILDAEERQQFEAHLPTCDRCPAEVARYRRVVAGLALAIDPVAPPETLRGKAIAKATEQRERAVIRPRDARSQAPRIGILGLLAAACLVLAAAAGIYAWSLRAQLDASRQLEAQASQRASTLRDQLNATRQDATRLTRTLDVLTAPDVMRVDLAGTAGAPSARGRAFWSASRGLFFTADQLPPLAAGRMYQLWLVIPKQAPISAGLLRVAANGSGSTLGALAANPAVPAATVVTFAITDEPAAGSPGPTTPILLAGSKKTE